MQPSDVSACVPVHAHDDERQKHKQLNSEGVCKRQDDDDYYYCRCFQGKVGRPWWNGSLAARGFNHRESTKRRDLFANLQAICQNILHCEGVRLQKAVKMKKKVLQGYQI